MAKIGEMLRLVDAEDIVTFEGRTVFNQLAKFLVSKDRRTLNGGFWCYDVTKNGRSIGSMVFLGPDDAGHDVYNISLKEPVNGLHQFSAIETAPDCFALVGLHGAPANDNFAPSNENRKRNLMENLHAR